MANLARDTLDAVRMVLASLPPGPDALDARFEDDGDPSTDAEIVLFSKADGRRHLVTIQVGDGEIGMNTAIHETKDLHGFQVVSFAAMRQGRPFRRPSPQFVSELRMALALAGDGFEPAPGPGIANHPLADIVIEQSAFAAAVYNAGRDDDDHISLSLNEEGQAEGENDVVSFVRTDGTVLPVEVRTMPGGASVHYTETGELLIERRADSAREELAEWICRCFDDAERMSPKP